MSRLASVLLAILVGLAPLALGGNRPLPWAYNAIFSGGIAVLCSLVLLQERNHRQSLRLGVIAVPMALWGLALGWAAIQLVPLGSSWLPHPAWSFARQALGDDLASTITVSLDNTQASLLRLLTYSVVFLTAFALSRDPDRAVFLLRALLLAGSVYVLYGLLRYSSGVNKLLWFDMPSSNVLTSTFINRNTACTYFGLLTCVAFGFLLRRASHVVREADGEPTIRRALEQLLAGLAGKLGLELVLFVLFLSATLLTQSRAGVAATVIGLFIGLVLNWMKRRRANGTSTAFVMLFILVAGGAVLQMSGAGVLERLTDTDVSHENRFAVYADTALAIEDNAWTGTGLGTFEDIFPLYRTSTPASDTIWDKAHNDYLEALLGLGIPAGLMLISGVGWLVLRSLAGIFERRRNSHMPLVGAMSGLVASIHSMFDFSLQIQAVALTLAVILGAAVAQSISDRAR